MGRPWWNWPTLAAVVVLTGAGGAEPAHRAMTLAESLAPYRGPVVRGVDTSTLRGKVMAGYQGWFMAAGDGYQPGWVHWGPVDREPPRCTVDLWPDLTDHTPAERFATNYRYPDGSRAEVFSSTVKQTVVRHFEWMRDYGIDGAFVQRFGSCIGNQSDWNYQRTCAVLSHCREAANLTGRAFAVMYDIGFDRRAVDIVKADWTRLIQEMEITSSPAYLRHRGAPVVSLWGYGFDHRPFASEAAAELLEFFRRPENGGCTIMLGLPNDWASWADDRMRLLTEHATIISPWNVGRYGSPEGAAAHAARYWPRDLEFCRTHDKDYYAVAFPGFSWTNLQQGRARLNAIPRLGGRFLWSQIELIRQYGMDMAYLAMFDEVDEGTAIFKCTNHPPVGRFATYEGLPSDHYLTLSGLAGRYLRGEAVSFPEVAPDPAQMTYRPLSQLEYYRQPSRFAAEVIARWRGWFQGVSLALHAEPYSGWTGDLYDSGAFDLTVSDWPTILAQGQPVPLTLIATGDEGFGTDVIAARVAEHLDRQLTAGGVVLVMSSGRYPLFYPGSGREAARFGFQLAMVNPPAGSRVVFEPALGELAAMEFKQPGSSRLMRRDLYPAETPYRSLARVELADGSAHGDAIAVVGRGVGWVIYVAGDLEQYPNREALLDGLLAQVHQALAGPGQG